MTLRTLISATVEYFVFNFNWNDVYREQKYFDKYYLFLPLPLCIIYWTDPSFYLKGNVKIFFNFNMEFTQIVLAALITSKVTSSYCLFTLEIFWDCEQNRSFSYDLTEQQYSSGKSPSVSEEQFSQVICLFTLSWPWVQVMWFFIRWKCWQVIKWKFKRFLIEKNCNNAWDIHSRKDI